jgi:hypothetical protein
VSVLAELRALRLGDLLGLAGKLLASYDPAAVFRSANFLVVGRGVEPRVVTAEHLGLLLVGSLTATTSVAVHLGPAGDRLARVMRPVEAA